MNTKTRKDQVDDIGFSRQLRQIYSHPTLTRGEDHRLFRQILQGGPGAILARERLINGVQPYVVKLARGYEGRGVPLEELIQEGNIGVLTAIERFDIGKGFAFLTFADDWIHQRMRRACTDRGSLEKYHMRMPCHMYMTIGRVQKVLPTLQEELGREPTPTEIVQRLDDLHAVATTTTENQVVTALEVLSRSTMSLDQHLTGEESDMSIGDGIADAQSPDIVDDMNSVPKADALWGAFEQLGEEERAVLSMRLGLGEDGKKYTQAETCEILGIRKSRLVTLQKRGLAKMRSCPQLRNFESAEID